MRATLYVLMIFLVACVEAEDRYDSGYSDGYAAGYNTTCEIRATIIEGDWSDENYTNGYEDGYLEGSEACLSTKSQY